MRRFSCSTIYCLFRSAHSCSPLGQTSGEHCGGLTKAAGSHYVSVLRLHLLIPSMLFLHLPRLFFQIGMHVSAYIGMSRLHFFPPTCLSSSAPGFLYSVLSPPIHPRRDASFYRLPADAQSHLSQQCSRPFIQSGINKRSLFPDHNSNRHFLSARTSHSLAHRKCIFAQPTAGNPPPFATSEKKKKNPSIFLYLLPCLRFWSPPSALTSRSTRTQKGHDFDINTQLPLKTH